MSGEEEFERLRFTRGRQNSEKVRVHLGVLHGVALSVLAQIVTMRPRSMPLTPVPVALCAIVGLVLLKMILARARIDKAIGGIARTKS